MADSQELHLQQLLRENQRLQSENQMLTTKVHDLIAEVTSLKSKSFSSFNSSKSMESDDFPTRGEVTNIIGTIQHQNKAKLSEIKKRHTEEYNALLKQYEMTKQKLQCLEQLQNTKNHNESIITEKLESLQNERSSMLVKISNLTHELQKLKDEKKNLARENSQLSENYEKNQHFYTKDVERARTELTKMKIDFQRMQINFEEKINSLTNQKEVLSQQLKEANERVTTLESQQSTIINNKNITLTQREKDKTDLLEKNQMLSDLHVKNEALSALNNKLQSQIEIAKKNEQEMKLNYSNLSEKYVTLQNEKNDILSTNREFRRQMSEKDQLLQESQLKNQELEYQKALLENQLQHDSTLKDKEHAASLIELEQTKTKMNKEKSIQKQLVKKMNDLSSRITEIENELIKEKNAKKIAEDSLTTIRIQMEELSKVNLALEDERNHLMEKTTNLQIENDSKSKEIDSLSLKVNQMIKDNLDLDNKAKNAEKVLLNMIQDQKQEENDKQTASEKEIDQMAKKQQELQESLQFIQSQYQMTLIENEQMKKEVSKKSATVTEITDALRKESKKLTAAIVDRKDAINKMERLRMENDELRKEMLRIQSESSIQLSQHDSTRKYVNEVEDRCKELQAQIEDLKAQNSAAQIKLESEISQHNSTKQTLQNITTQAKQLRSLCFTIKEENTKLRQRQKASKTEIKSLNQSMDSLSKENSQLNDQLSSLQSSLELSQDSQMTDKNSFMKLSQDYADANTKINALKLQIRTNERTIDHLSTQLQQKESEIHSAISDNDALQREKKNLEHANKLLNDDIMGYKTQISVLEGKLKSELLQRTDLSAQIDEEKDKHFDNVQSQINDTYTKLRTAEKLLRQATKRLTQSEDKREELQTQNNQKDEKIKALEQEKAELQRKINANESLILTMKKNDETSKEMINDLNKELVKAKHSMDSASKASSEEKAELEALFHEKLEQLKHHSSFESSKTAQRNIELNEQLVHLEQKVDDMEGNIKKAQDAADKAQKAQKVEQEKAQKAERDLAKTQQDMKVLELRVQSLTKEKEDIAAQHKQSEEKLQAANTDLNNFMLKAREGEKYKDLHSDLSKKCDEALNTITKLTSENESLKAQLNSLTEETDQRIRDLENKNEMYLTELENDSKQKAETTSSANELLSIIRNIQHLLHPEGVDDANFNEALPIATQVVNELQTLKDMLLKAFNDVQSLIDCKRQAEDDIKSLTQQRDKYKASYESSIFEKKQLLAENQSISSENLLLNQSNKQYSIERINLNNGIATLRSALQMTKEELKKSEEEKKEAVTRSTHYKQILDDLKDKEGINIEYPE